MTKAIPFVFLVLGFIGFLIPTEFLTRTSETALVNGSYGLVAGILGMIGALVGRRSAGLSVGLGLAFAVGAVLLMVLFFMVLWPLL